VVNFYKKSKNVSQNAKADNAMKSRFLKKVSQNIKFLKIASEADNAMKSNVFPLLTIFEVKNVSVETFF